MLDALKANSSEVPASVDATFSWYFRDEDRWLTVECQRGRVSVRPGLQDTAEMRFYSACVSDFIHQHTTEGAGRAIFQGGGFYWRGDISLLKEISPLCKNLFGPRLHQRLVGGGIAVPKFESRRYPARTKAQRDRIFAEWLNQGERVTRASAPPRPVLHVVAGGASDVRPVSGAVRKAPVATAAKQVVAPQAPRATVAAKVSKANPKVARKA